MSRPSHVHEKELVEEVEQRRNEQKRRRGGCGCMSCLTVLGIFLILAVVASLFSLGWIRNHFPKELQPWVEALKPAPSQTPSVEKTPAADWKTRSSEWLSNTREKAASIQKNLEELQKSGKMAEQLQALRDALAQKQESAEKFSEKEMQDLTQMLDGMITQAKKQGDNLRSVDFDKLKSQMDALVKLLPQKSESDKTSKTSVTLEK
jgi:hypothetical protein